MSAFDTGGHQSLFAYLGGLILLVFAGIILSLAMEKRHGNQKEASSLESKISSQAELIGDLKRQTDTMASRLNDSIIRSDDQGKEMEKLTALLSEQRITLRRLEEEQSQLQAGNLSLEESAEQFLSNQRKTARRKIVGITNAQLILADGTAYQDVTIRSVKGQVLSFSHARGFARVNLKELNEAWKAKLAWSPDELITRGSEESTPESPSRTEPRTVTEPDDSPSRIEEKRAAISAARSEFIEQRNLYQRAISETANARSKTHGSERSVPGSLETWEERAQRMDRLVQKYRFTYQLARDKLMAVSPGDPLLQPNR